MDTWIRADYRFTDHRGIFFLSTTELWHVPGWKTLLKEQCPWALGAALTKLLAQVEDGRYAGATVLGLQYNLPYDRWQVLFMHHDLPAVRPGEQAEELEVCVTTADLHAALEPVREEVR